jgi:hypothetical protein
MNDRPVAWNKRDGRFNQGETNLARNLILPTKGLSSGVTKLASVAHAGLYQGLKPASLTRSVDSGGPQSTAL